MTRDGKYITVNTNSRTSSEVRMKYLPSIKDTPKEDRTNLSIVYKITSKRGQSLYKGQKAGSQVCPLFGGPTVITSRGPFGKYKSHDLSCDTTGPSNEVT